MLRLVSRALVGTGVVLVSFIGIAPAFEDERLSIPSAGEVVSEELHFHIEASGEPEPEEFFRIEIALDADFESIVDSFDNREDRAGWAIASPRGLEDVPERYRPTAFEGIHLRPRKRFEDGTYYWRAFKAVGSGAWEPIPGTESFVVDTIPPQPVESLQVRRSADGALQLSWSPVGYDLDGQPERVAGFRVYQYTKLLRMYRPMTRNIVTEGEATTVSIPAEALESERIVFFRVQAVDEVGNEEGRTRPKRIGELELARTHASPDLLTNPDYLRQLSQQEADD